LIMSTQYPNLELGDRIVVVGTGVISVSLCTELVINRRCSIIVLTRNVERAKRGKLGSLARDFGLITFLSWVPESVPLSNYLKLSPSVEVQECVTEQDQKIIKEMEGCSCVINLSGKPLFGSYCSKKKVQNAEMNRVLIIRHLAYLISHCKDKPRILFHSSSTSYYGIVEDTSTIDNEYTEESSHGNDFWGHGAQIIETEVKNLSKNNNVAVINMRFGLVITSNSKIIKSQLPALRSCIGDGNQWIPWIHIDDAVGIIILLIDIYSKISINSFQSLAVNITNPNPVKQKEFARILNDTLGLHQKWKTPIWKLKIFVGKPAEILAKSRKVLPSVIIQLGYKFKFLSLQAALKKEFSKSIASC